MSAPDERRSAVALTYREGEVAPQVVAKGYGVLAESIIEHARAHGVYVHESPELVSLLMQVDMDRHIPQELYLAVAELLAWIYRLEQGLPADAPPEQLLREPEGSLGRSTPTGNR